MKMLVDGSKLFFSSRKMLGRSRLDYPKLAQMTQKDRYYFTSFDPNNDRQESFLRILQGAGFQVHTQHVTGDTVYDFDSHIAYLLGQAAMPCMVVSNSPYLVPLIMETSSTLCWFSSDLPPVALLAIYRDKKLNFRELEDG
jgi:hypothetical protein